MRTTTGPLIQLLRRVAGPVVLAGFVVLLVVGALTSEDHEVGGPAAGTDPVQPLIEAFERSRTATYRASGVFTRTAPDGRTLSAEVTFVQRPPDRLDRRFGSVSGRRDDRLMSCPALASGGTIECELGSPGRSFDEVVEAEVEAFTELVTGPDPLYGVRRLARDCWRLDRTRYDPRSGYGVSAVLCFDIGLGAIRRLEIDHGDIVEVTEWTDRSAHVTDADLDP